MQSKQVREYKKALISTIMVVAISTWAYVLAYFYEYGYLSHFGIPPEVMRIQYINIVAAVLSVLFFVYAVFSFGYNSLHKAAKSPKKAKLLLVVWLLFVVIFGLLPVVTLQSLVWRLFAVIGVISVTGRMAWEIYRSPGTTFEEKLMAAIENQERDPFLSWAEGRLGESTMMTIAFVLFTFYAAFMAGSQWATFGKKTYPVISYKEQQLVVIRTYAEVAIATPWTPDTKAVTKQFFVIPVVELSTADAIQMKEVGPLQLNP